MTAATSADADVQSLLASLRGQPLSPLRPAHLISHRAVAPRHSDRRRETIGDHDDRRRAPLLGAAASPSLMQLKDQLLEVIGEQLQQPSNLTFESEPLHARSALCRDGNQLYCVDPCPGCWRRMLSSRSASKPRKVAAAAQGLWQPPEPTLRSTNIAPPLLLEATALADPASSSSHRLCSAKATVRRNRRRTHDSGAASL